MGKNLSSPIPPQKLQQLLSEYIHKDFLEVYYELGNIKRFFWIQNAFVIRDNQETHYSIHYKIKVIKPENKDEVLWFPWPSSKNKKPVRISDFCFLSGGDMVISLNEDNSLNICVDNTEEKTLQFSATSSHANKDLKTSLTTAFTWRMATYVILTSLALLVLWQHQVLVQKFFLKNLHG